MKERELPALTLKIIFYCLFESFSTVNVTGSITRTLKNFTLLIFFSAMFFLFLRLSNKVKGNVFLFFDISLAVLLLFVLQLLHETKKYLLKHIKQPFEFFAGGERMSRRFEASHRAPVL
jgi:hypothetical protein